MFCTKCGTQIPDESRFCYKCGTAVAQLEQKDMISLSTYDTTEPSSPAQDRAPAQAANQIVAPSPTEKSMCGLVGFILAFFVPFVGFVLSLIGYGKKENDGFSIAGIIISVIGIIAFLSIVIFIVETQNNYSFYPYLYY